MNHLDSCLRLAPGMICFSGQRTTCWGPPLSLSEDGAPLMSSAFWVVSGDAIILIVATEIKQLLGWSLCFYVDGTTPCLGWVQNDCLRWVS